MGCIDSPWFLKGPCEVSERIDKPEHEGGHTCMGHEATRFTRDLLSQRLSANELVLRV
ncbi:hypothetical protein SCFA_790005 [anaerobic digester metagenome]|uniref:Uncharacterized protein n=1 Tax=anaerobic digester metagenome TaxID=1263854 RepID=A0A485M628_9ZZZZ